MEKYFTDTNAFIELSGNPLNEILDKVVQLLDRLYSKNLIWKWQYEKMMPNRTKSELSHLYFNPKTHKVSTDLLLVLLLFYLNRTIYPFVPLKIPCVLQQQRFQSF